MNPELPAEEMKKPSSPVAHSLVSSVQRQTGGSLPKSALCLLSTGLSAPTAGATVEGQCGCWCLELTGGRPRGKWRGGDQFLLNSQWATLRGNTGLAWRCVQMAPRPTEGRLGDAPKADHSLSVTLLLLGLQRPERQMDLVKIHGRGCHFFFFSLRKQFVQ